MSQSLRELAEDLRSRKEVVSVERRCDFDDGGNRPSVEWYVDAELANDEAISFRLLLYWLDGEWIVEADVRRVHAAGSDPEVEFATRYATDEDLEQEILSAMSHLVGSAASVTLTP